MIKERDSWIDFHTRRRNKRMFLKKSGSTHYEATQSDEPRFRPVNRGGLRIKAYPPNSRKFSKVAVRIAYGLLNGAAHDYASKRKGAAGLRREVDRWLRGDDAPWTFDAVCVVLGINDKTAARVWVRTSGGIGHYDDEGSKSVGCHQAALD